MPRSYNLDKNLPTAHQRKPDYMRDDDWIREFLLHGQIAHIASVWDDQPFITPTTYFYDEAGHRLIFHSNITGRIRANIENHPKVCVEVSELGRLLPSNVALEFSLQFRSVVIFGSACILEDKHENVRYFISSSQNILTNWSWTAIIALPLLRNWIVLLFMR